MAKSFTAAQWTKVEALTDARGAAFGLPERRGDSVVLASFNIRKIGRIKNKSPGAWAFLKRFCERCDLIAVQEVQDSLEALVHLKGLLGAIYGLAVSDVTGGIAGKQAMVERLAFLFRWDRIERSEVASDNAHLLYGHKDKQADERRMEFSGLLKWLIERARKAKTMYHKNIILLGDLNLYFRAVDARRDAIEAEIKMINDRDLKRRAKIYFPFIDVHPERHEVFRSNARHSQSYDQIAIVSNDPRLPRPADKKKAGSVAGGYDFGMFDFVNLFAEALHGKPFDRLTAKQQTALIARFQHDVSDHMPIWIRLAKPR